MLKVTKFGGSSLCDSAGFARVRVASEPYLPFGIHWPEPWSVPLVAYA